MASPNRLKLRALVFGSGWGEHSVRAFDSDPRVRLAGIVGRGSARTRELAKSLAVPAFDDVEKAIAATAPEVASVAVNEREGPAIAEALLKRGCHVLAAHPVAADAATVRSLAALAETCGRVIATDYTLRLQPGFTAARQVLDRSGALLRAVIEAPGRALIMAADLAIGLAGPVASVLASPLYPAALDERIHRSPKSFPPTLLFEHRCGCVTVVVPVPHAAPASAHRITLSAERARIDLALPAGEVRALSYLGGGQISEYRILKAEPSRSASEVFAGPMRELARRFVDSVTSGAPVHAGLMEEAHLRDLWAAAQRSARERCPVDVER